MHEHIHFPCAYTEAVPKKILEIMNVDGLTRENVASHLQKYRLYLKRVASVSGTGISIGMMPGLVASAPSSSTAGSSGRGPVASGSKAAAAAAAAASQQQQQASGGSGGPGGGSVALTSCGGGDVSTSHNTSNGGGRAGRGGGGGGGSGGTPPSMTAAGGGNMANMFPLLGGPMLAPSSGAMGSLMGVGPMMGTFWWGGAPPYVSCRYPERGTVNALFDQEVCKDRVWSLC